MIKFISEKLRIKKKLTYTTEMEKQDSLWEDEQENLEVMEMLQKSIINEATEKGFKGATFTYVVNENEVITDVFESRQQMEEGYSYESDIEMPSCGNCKELIKVLEKELNKK